MGKLKEFYDLMLQAKAEDIRHSGSAEPLTPEEAQAYIDEKQMMMDRFVAQVAIPRSIARRNGQESEFLAFLALYGSTELNDLRDSTNKTIQ
jgi:hypothetical protein